MNIICGVSQNQITTTSTPSLLHKLKPPLLHPPTTAATRRCITLATLLLSTKPAAAFDFRMTVPDQTVEEAELAIKPHAQSLVKIKDLLMAERWKEAQKELRKSSSLLKQDFYTIIQGKPYAERPRLRELYSDLFNGVTKLDYAARDKDKIRVWKSYHSIALSLHRILSAI
ncbi:hypothetical protein ACS0TY_029775 [Phlomoides rotata]